MECVLSRAFIFLYFLLFYFENTDNDHFAGFPLQHLTKRLRVCFGFQLEGGTHFLI